MKKLIPLLFILCSCSVSSSEEVYTDFIVYAKIDRIDFQEEVITATNIVYHKILENYSPQKEIIFTCVSSDDFKFISSYLGSYTTIGLTSSNSDTLIFVR